jgi:carbon-monoxide dehydrogenase medium subunit
MIPVQFDYIAPENLADAVKLLAARDGALALAGGHSVLLDLKRRRLTPTLLVDLRNIPELRGIRPAQGGGLDIGAMTTYAELLAWDEVRQNYHCLAEAIAGLGDAQVRHRATLGGSLARNDPTADLPAVALALQAQIKTISPSGRRALAAEAFLAGPGPTPLKRGEIITTIHLPATVPSQGTAYEKFPCPATGSAICGVAATVTRGKDDGDTVYRLFVVGATEHAVRLRKVEAALLGQRPTASSIASAAAQVVNEALPYVSDFHASPEYRAHLTRVLAERALSRAANRAG